MLKEYVVTLQSRDNLEEFYQDMENPGGNLHIPSRSVDAANRRPASRNTHYMLTDQEAINLRNDSRVINVELLPSELGIIVKSTVNQFSDNWNKSDVAESDQKNWGLLRVVEGTQRPRWGSDDIANQSSSIEINYTGKNVDVVIVDGHFDPSHPEFAVNPDGSGQSRVVQYNWFQYNLSVSGRKNNVYVYTPYADSSNIERMNDNDHGSHVAGIAAGNTQGWARSANIYNINPYSTNINYVRELYIFDYIRLFHANKPINSSTGTKNPTIINNSWGYFYEIPIREISSVSYRGNIVLRGENLSADNLSKYGIINDGVYTVIPTRYHALDADIEDAIDDGIIIVGASGNDSMKIDVSNGADYKNYFTWNHNYIYYHAGNSPGTSPGTISVGAISSLSNEQKASWSNCGPRVDVYSPGEYIISAINNTEQGVSDPRNSKYSMIKYSGTSMACPQVTGVLACMLEKYPNMTQEQAKNYIAVSAKQFQIPNVEDSYTDFSSLQGSQNKYLFYDQQWTSDSTI